jgi:hypothetical protein
MSKPGIVLRRPVGSDAPFSEHPKRRRLALVLCRSCQRPATPPYPTRASDVCAQGADWTVTSGYRGDRIFYRRAMLACHNTKWRQLSLNIQRQKNASSTVLSPELLTRFGHTKNLAVNLRQCGTRTNATTVRANSGLSDGESARSNSARITAR